MRVKSAIEIGTISKLTIVLLVGIISCVPLWCQVTGGTFTGTVQDQAGAVIPDASITFTQVQTGNELRTKTTSAGVYYLAFIPIGQYKIAAEKQGFATTVFGPIALEANTVERVDLVLKVGSASQTVTVQSGEQQVLREDSGEISQVIENEQISQLPLNGRDWTSLIGLSAGVTADPTGGFNVNGQRAQGNTLMTDGVSQMTGEGHADAIDVPEDAVAEYSIQQNGFSAQYGNASGGIIEVQTKEGTNKFHGDVFEYIRNSATTAHQELLPSVPLDIFNQFGGSVGGPIRKNKTFFFYDDQATRPVTATGYLGYTPTAQQRKGDFSGLYNGAPQGPIFDPSTGTPLAPGVPINTGRVRYSYQGVNDWIPPTSQDPAAMALINGMPPANYVSSNAFLNYDGMVKLFYPINSMDVRIDNSFSDRNHLMGRWSLLKGMQHQGSEYGPQIGGGGTELRAGNNPISTWQVGLIDTFTINANMVNEARFGVQRWYSGLVNEHAGQNSADQIGMPDINVPGISGTTGLPFFLVIGAFSLGDSIASPCPVRDTVPSVADTLSWTRGRHSMRFGAEYSFAETNFFSFEIGRGLFVMLNLTTGSFDNLLATGSWGGNALATFESGTWYELVIDERKMGVALRDPRAAVFAQDDWKLSPKFTVNLGIRWDYLPPAYDKNNNLSDFDPATVSVKVAGQNGNSRTLHDTVYHDFSPHVGFAWTFMPNTVLRAGTAISYLNLLNSTTQFHELSDNIPNYFSNTVYQNLFTNGQYTLHGGFPRSTLLAYPPLNMPQGNAYYERPSDPPQYSVTWNLAIQRALTKSLSLEASYMGATGVHLSAELNVNQGGPGSSSSTSAAVRRPYYAQDPGLATVLEEAASEHSSYNAGALKLEKKYAGGLSILAGYTWSKSIDNFSSSFAATAQNPFNMRAERGPSSFDRTQRFVASAVYQLPFGRGQHFGSHWNSGADMVLGGWQLSTIGSKETGAPFTVNDSCADLYADGGGCRPDQLSNPNQNIPGGRQTKVGAYWFNPAAFAVPGKSGPEASKAPAYGNTGRNTLRGPGDWNDDLGINKYFKWGDAAERRIQLRFDAYNAFNHVNWAQPDSGFDDPSFGQMTEVNYQSRRLDGGLRFEF